MGPYASREITDIDIGAMKCGARCGGQIRKCNCLRSSVSHWNCLSCDTCWMPLGTQLLKDIEIVEIKKKAVIKQEVK
jgi:hypothetical protein